MSRTRSSRSALVGVLASSPRPIYVVDERRKLVYCNPACIAWLGVDEAALVGQRCDYHNGQQLEGAARAAARLCPPPEAFAGVRTSAVIHVSAGDEPSPGRRADFIPLGDDNADCAGVLVLISQRELDASGMAAAASDEPSPQQLHEQLQLIQHEMANRFGLDQLVGRTPAMRRARRQMALAMSQPAPTLVTGPPGSGREHVARTIHYGARRRPGSGLVPLSCSLLDVELLKGVLDDVKSQSAQSEPGETPALLLLDVDELAAPAQTELAETLLAGDLALRTIATARGSLVERAERGDFRSDLALSLSTLVIELPALAERADDIPLLAQYFLERANAGGSRQLGGFSQEALDEMAQYVWPENVDELAEVVQSAARRAEGPLVTLADLPKQIRLAADAAAHPPRAEQKIVLDEWLKDVEAELVRRALGQAKGNKAQAARMLGVSRARLLRRIACLGLDS